MSDQGRGYGSEPWSQGQPRQGGPNPGYPQQPPYRGPQPGHPGGQQQPYPGPGQQPGGPGPQQQPYPGQQPGRPGPQQQPYPGPQQAYPGPQPGHPGPPQGYPGPQPGGPQPGHPGPPQGYPGHQGQPGYPHSGAWGGPQQPQDPYSSGQYPVVQQPQQPRPQARGPVLGPDGIDWEAEAAALEADVREPDQEPDHGEPPYQDPDHGTGEHPAVPGDDYEDEEYHPFLAAEDDSRSGERRRRQQGRTQRKRSGVACLGMSLLLLIVLGAGGYFGYGEYQKHFGPPADYKGMGTGSVSVVVKDGDVGTDIGNTLVQDGVVASTKAFVNAYNDNSKAISIQPGAYTLAKKMSAANAVAALVAANGGDALIIPEGLPAAKIYPMVDKKLGLSAGATAAAAKADVAKLGLPSYAHGNIEGFLWPARYSITKGMKPDDLLKEMVATAVGKFDSLGMDSGASAVKLKSGYQVLIEASILQAEGNNQADFGKIARVLYNRLNTNDTQGNLGLDTTLQYALKSTHFTYAQKNNDSAGGYNTYINKGLPPGPISNPGDAAVQAVLNPTPGNWAYFIAMTPSNTQFTETFAQFKVLVQQYCTAHKLGFDSTAGACV
ncbi:endolytic transglycosylase MltG [Streptacidiphilus cavernicola]|uniref:Endolytic murein transglycosylase n=1 Tax=Streptacidiphilus cavernicola TaxID=3342716 RepID=A0ABV6VQG9_9ACTN